MEEYFDHGNDSEHSGNSDAFESLDLMSRVDQLEQAANNQGLALGFDDFEQNMDALRTVVFVERDAEDELLLEREDLLLLLISFLDTVTLVNFYISDACPSTHYVAVCRFVRKTHAQRVAEDQNWDGTTDVLDIPFESWKRKVFVGRQISDWGETFTQKGELGDKIEGRSFCVTFAPYNLHLDHFAKVLLEWLFDPEKVLRNLTICGTASSEERSGGPWCDGCVIDEQRLCVIRNSDPKDYLLVTQSVGIEDAYGADSNVYNRLVREIA